MFSWLDRSSRSSRVRLMYACRAMVTGTPAAAHALASLMVRSTVCFPSMSISNPTSWHSASLARIHRCPQAKVLRRTSTRARWALPKSTPSICSGGSALHIPVGGHGGIDGLFCHSVLAQHVDDTPDPLGIPGLNPFQCSWPIGERPAVRFRIHAVDSEILPINKLSLTWKDITGAKDWLPPSSRIFILLFFLSLILDASISGSR